MKLTRSSIISVIKTSIATLTKRFNPADMNENTVLQDVDIDDTGHLRRLRNRIFLAVTDTDNAVFSRNAFMVEQTYDTTDKIARVADCVRNGIDSARVPKED